MNAREYKEVLEKRGLVESPQSLLLIEEAKIKQMRIKQMKEKNEDVTEMVEKKNALVWEAVGESFPKENMYAKYVNDLVILKRVVEGIK